MNLLVQQIHTLDDLEKSYMIHNLRTFIPQHTRNTNGFFFNLTFHDKHVVEKIRSCLKVIMDNRKIIDESTKERDSIISEYKSHVLTKVKINQPLFVDTKIKSDYSNIQITIKEPEVFNYQDPLLLFQNYNKKLNEKNKQIMKILNKKKNNAHYSTDSSKSYCDDKYNTNQSFDDNNDYYDTIDDMDDIGIIDSDFNNEYSDNISECSDSTIQSYHTENNSLTTSEIYRRLGVYRELLIEKGYVFDELAYEILQFQPYL
jgi:hypothetical protein